MNEAVMTGISTTDFVQSLPVLESFSQALPMEGYVPLPDDWLIAVTDVVKSREAIKAGRFKPVNMAGVAFISAVMNALDHQEIPYIFSGDGAAIACSPQQLETVKTAMEQTVGWVEDDLDLKLRGSIVPVSHLRSEGVDVRVAAVRVSSAIKNFAFSGGGVARAEQLMKAGEFRIERRASGDRPDLTGLSCRWTPIGEENSSILSLIIEPAEGRNAIPADVLDDIMTSVRGNEPGGNPMPESGPGFQWPTRTTALETLATGRSTLAIHLESLLALVLFKTGIKLGSFDARKYWRDTSLNTDYRKIQDGLRMTVSLAKGEVKALRDKLENYRQTKQIRFGLCEQDKAVLTCYVPTVTSESHYHFLDGSGGGYAAAADDIH